MNLSYITSRKSSLLSKPPTPPNDGMIFVFGSNLMGIHGAGAAREAYNLGFPWGLGCGLHVPSMCYALPTKLDPSASLAPVTIELYVDQLLEMADILDDFRFKVTRVGCGLAGFEDSIISAMFDKAPPNCLFDEKWKLWLGSGARYWGTY